MRINRITLAAACSAAALVAGGLGLAQAAPSEVVVAGSVADAVVSSPPVGAVAAGQSLKVQLRLKGNETGATAFADSVSDRKYPNYRRYLSPKAFTAAYGASAAGTSLPTSPRWTTRIRPTQTRSRPRATTP
jgi:hypothetical protein